MDSSSQQDGEIIAVTLIPLARLISLRIALLKGSSQDKDPRTIFGEAFGAPKHDVELGDGLILLGNM